ncbi:MAG TPA: hypothetical protein VLG46_06810 [Anaerolineae bacterium]|nr:hypothetical protein [Anaerolineae bacterium]
MKVLEATVGALIQQAIALDRTFSLRVVNRITTESDRGVIADRLTVELKADHPEANSWAVIAALRFDRPGQVQISAVPGCGVPNRFLHTTPTCGHCATHAGELLVLRNLHTGACLQIGRGCATSVLGDSGQVVVQYADLLTPALQPQAVACGACVAVDQAAWKAQDNELDAHPADHYAYRLDKYLAQVARQIALHGWVSRRQAEATGKPPTCELALEARFAVHEVTPEAVAVAPSGPLPDGGYGQTAGAALAWARQLARDDRNLDDYELRLHEIAQKDVIAYGEIGLAASMIQAHHAAAQRAIEQQLTARPS